MTNLIVKEVTFNNVTLIGVQKDSKIFVAIKKICDDLGLDFSSQLKKIKESSLLSKGVAEITTPTNGGMQNILYLDSEFLPFYLSGIKEKKCKPEIRPYLLEFQLKAKDVLAQAFFNKQEEPKVMSSEELALVQAQNILNLRKDLNEVKTMVQDLVDEKQKNLEQLKIIEMPKVLPLQKSDRSKLVQLIRTYSRAKSIQIPDAWNLLYDEFKYTYHIDIKQCASNRKISNLDYVESIAKIPELYALAYELFVNEKKAGA